MMGEEIVVSSSWLVFGRRPDGWDLQQPGLSLPPPIPCTDRKLLPVVGSSHHAAGGRSLFAADAPPSLGSQRPGGAALLPAPACLQWRGPPLGAGAEAAGGPARGNHSELVWKYRGEGENMWAETMELCFGIV
jgi:hypothetical protein